MMYVTDHALDVMQKGAWQLLVQVHHMGCIWGPVPPAVIHLPQNIWSGGCWTVVSPHVSTCRELVPRKCWRRKALLVIKCLFVYNWPLEAGKKSHYLLIHHPADISCLQPHLQPAAVSSCGIYTTQREEIEMSS